MAGLEARFRSAHELVCRAASEQGCRDSQLVNGVSRHVLPSTASFANLAALLAAAQQAGKHVAQRAFVATSGARLVFSCKFDGVSPSERSRAAPAAAAAASPAENGEATAMKVDDTPDEGGDDAAKLAKFEKKLAKATKAGDSDEVRARARARKTRGGGGGGVLAAGFSRAIVSLRRSRG